MIDNLIADAEPRHIFAAVGSGRIYARIHALQLKHVLNMQSRRSCKPIRASAEIGTRAKHDFMSHETNVVIRQKSKRCSESRCTSITIKKIINQAPHDLYRNYQIFSISNQIHSLPR
jgi:hypothetical protein